MPAWWSALKLLLGVAAVAAVLAALVPASGPAKALLAAKRQLDPDDPVAYCDEVLAQAAQQQANLSAAEATAKRVLVVGDSWAALAASGSRLGLSFFERKLREHKCGVRATSIAVGGTTTSDWLGSLKGSLIQGAQRADYVWIVLMGNDALERMPDCAQQHKSAAACGDELFAEMVGNMGKLADIIHEANPQAIVVGFGYDTMFGGLGCGLVTRSMFPQCYRFLHGGGNRCFNEQFLRIQGVWDTIAANRTWVRNTSILGATQVAAGDTKASTGADRHIDMDKMGPAKYWPNYEGCFHPGVLGGENSGAMVVMEEFYRSFWSKELNC